MSKLIESRFYSVLITISDYLLLGILWIIGCLPLVSFTASCRGALATVLIWHKDGATGNIFRHYLTNFKKHFGSSLLVTLLIAALLLVNHLNLTVMTNGQADMRVLGIFLLVSTFVCFGAFCGYLRQDICNPQSLIKSLQAGVFDFLSSLPRFILLALVTIVYAGLIFIFPLFLFIFAGAFWKLAGLLLRKS